MKKYFLQLLCFGIFFHTLNTLLPAQDLLPPVRPWQGESEKLIAPVKDPWITPAEVSGFNKTPDYRETTEWLKKLCDASSLLTMVSAGTSPEGRDIWLITASLTDDISPEGLEKTGKPLLFVQAGIHSGEIDGKDAGLMLLRDIAFRGRESLLEKVNLIFIPILNVDGHERSSPFNRINQRGPENMGWRTNSQNLNLNRDFAKLDTREVRTVVKILNEYDPDLFADIHVTDGADYQYDITMGSVGKHGYSPAIATALEKSFYPAVYSKLRQMGHCPGPMLFAFNDEDYSDGIVDYCFGPSFSDNYADARHIPSVLVENHSLKPYRQRVLGTYVFLESCLEFLAASGNEFRKAKAVDMASRNPRIPNGFRIPQFRELGMWGNSGESKPDNSIPPDSVDLLGISSVRKVSPVTGGKYIQWTGEPVEVRVPVYRMNEPAAYIDLPKAYWIPAAYGDVIERLKIHGIKMEVISEPIEKELEMYRITSFEFARSPYENHMRVSGQTKTEIHKKLFPAGSVRIPVDQELGDLAALLLEPSSGDSFFQWGFFLQVFSRTEYAETYALEPLAEKMLKDSPQLRQEFEEKKAGDLKFAADPEAILRWFYQRSPFYDDQYLLYPVGLER
jgi:hypothetical protein